MWLPTQIPNDDFTSKYVEIYEKHQAGLMTEEDWLKWRNSQFLKVVEKTKKSEFYKNRIDYSEINSLDDLEKIPFTTKDDLRDRMHDLLSGSMNDALYFYETTGTTGLATPCPRDYKEAIASNAQVTAAWRDIFDKIFGENYRPVVGLMGPTEVHSFGDTLGMVCQNMNVCNMKIWPYSPVIGFEKALSLMSDCGVEVIVCTPGVAMNLMKAARYYEYDLKKDFKVKAVFLTGEMSTKGLMNNIKSIWGVEVFNVLYGSQEAFVMGSARADGSMYVAKPNYLFEVINPETDKSVGSVGTGELCVTMLMDGIKPLLRYRTGDLVTITATGKQEPLDLKIEVIGRVKDQLILNNRNFPAHEIESAILDPIENCYGYQIIINSIDDEDVLNIRVEFSSGANSIEQKLVEIKNNCLKKLGCTANVEVVSELDQIVSTAAFVSWKAARIIDQRVNVDKETEVAMKLAENRDYR